MEISNAAIGSPSLRAEALQRVNNISIETEDDSLFEDHIDGLLDAIQQGHNEVFGMIKKCKNFFNETSEALDNKLDSLMDSVGFPDMSDMIEKIAELDPRRLVKCVPSMVKELETSLIKYKVLILGVLLNVALVYVTPLIPYVETLGMACSFTPSLFVPLFKLLTVIGSSSNDAAIKCLVVIAKIAKSDLVKDPAHQSALLEAVNVIKDSCQYCNIFKPDTIECFREYGAANAIVFKNITTWNAGKSARKGDKQKYLVNAGVVPVQSQSSWFGTSPMKSANRGMVSPSPMSQNIAQLQDKDIDGTEATDDSHMTDGSGLQSSSMPAAAGYVNTPVGPAFSGLSNLSTDSQRPPPNSPFNNYPNNGTPFMSSSKMSTRFDGTFTGESKPSEDGPALSFSEFVARQKTNGGTPMTNNNQPNSFGNSSALVSQKLDFSGAVGANAASKNYGDVMAPINYNGSTKSSARFAGTGGTNSWDVPISNSNNNGFGSPSVKSTIVRESTPVASSSSSMKVGPVRNSTSPSPVESNDASNEVAVKAKGGFFSAFFGRGRNGKVGAVNTPNKLDPIQENASSRNLTPNLRTSTSAGSVKSSSKAGGTLFQENNTSSTKRQNSPATFQSPSSRTLNVGSSMKSMRNVPMSKEEAEMMELRAQLAQLQSQKSPGFGINQ